MIVVQEDDFLIENLVKQIKQQAGNNAGAISTFTGLVREKDLPGQAPLTALKLEHYPGMTEKALAAIAQQAEKRFDLSSVVIVHRIGKLSVGEQIVFVGTSSEHRESAFNGCQFIMDYLKNDAPFWKKEYRADGTENWIEQKQSDVDTIKNWQ